MGDKVTRIRILKWCIVGIVILILWLVLLSLLARVDRLPERTLAHDFLLTNESVTNEFGIPLSASYAPGYSLMSLGAATVEGAHAFDIQGTKKNGRVLVHWQSTGEGRDFAVCRIELLSHDEPPRTIWLNPAIKSASQDQPSLVGQ